MKWYCDSQVTVWDDVVEKDQFLVWAFDCDAPDPIYIAAFARFEDAEQACNAQREAERNP